MIYDTIVVGAGPSGCSAAERLATEGFSVLILEEHRKVGEPVQCAGLISPRTLQVSGVTEDVVINRLTGVRVFSPLGARLDICAGREHALAVDRAAFDRYLAERAQEAGAELLTGARVRDLQRTGTGYRVTAYISGNCTAFDARLVIGADGANSLVAKKLALPAGKNPRAVMYAADVELHREDTSLVDIFLGRQLAPGWFGWVIPLNKHLCRVGTGHAFCRRKHSPSYLFRNIIRSFPEHFRDMKIIRYTGGIVPMGLAPRIYAPHALLVGDAACQTKPISGGGIYLGLRGAQVCAAVAARALREDDLSEKKLARYQQLWEEEFAEEINCGVGHRQSYLRFSDSDIDQLLRFLDKPYWKSLILKHGDIDYPSWLARRLFSAGPWMQKFVRAALALNGYGLNLKNGLKNILS